jgi:hypothetical protein
MIVEIPLYAYAIEYIVVYVITFLIAYSAIMRFLSWRDKHDS